MTATAHKTETIVALPDDYLIRGWHEATVALPSASMLVDQLIRKNSLASIVGKSGAGKSAVVHHIALSVAAGVPALDRYAVAEAAPVLFISSDSKRSVLARTQAWFTVNKVNLPGVPLMPCHGSFMWSCTLPVLTSASNATFFFEAIRRSQKRYAVNPRLIVLDGRSQILADHDENTAEASRLFARLKEHLRDEFNCAVITTQPALKLQSDVIRGTAAFGDVDDAIWSVERSGDQVTVKSVKSRELPPFDPITLRITPQAQSFTLQQAGSSGDQ